MCEEKCRRPCLYTRSKSACRKSRALRGNLPRPVPGSARFDSPDTLAVTVILNSRSLIFPEYGGRNSGLRGFYSAPLDYSRNPGFTETLLRPLARRREITFLPPWVFMRVRNPCVFTRLRRLGWNVRLGMKCSRS